ncbi:MAG: hypothetical protein JWR21_91 [Herminiimonas sp.]|nr:hypothetical protein [Herminiimonas sp.]
MTAISWSRCSLIYGDLAPEERAALKKYQHGDLFECPPLMVEQLKTRGIVQLIDGLPVLTDEGRMIAMFC